jgi:hypothetical protein
MTIINPGGEDGITGWTAEYGNIGNITESIGYTVPHSGNNALYVGPSSPSACAAQELDLVGQGVPACNIDKGNLQFELASWLAGYTSQRDSASLSVRFKDEDKNTISTSENTWSYSGDSWHHTPHTRYIPPTTRFVDIRLLGLRYDEDNCDAYFDDLTARVLPVEKAYVIGSSRGIAANGNTALTMAKPAGVKEGDILIAFVTTRNKYCSDSGGPEGSGWTLIKGVDVYEDSVVDPWVKGTDEQAGIWWKVAGDAEPSTYTVALVDNGVDDYAGGILTAIGGIVSPTVLDISTSISPSLTLPSVNSSNSGIVIALWGCSYDSPFNSPDSIFWSNNSSAFEGLNWHNAGGNLSQMACSYVPPADGPTGDVTASSSSTFEEYLYEVLISFSQGE